MSELPISPKEMAALMRFARSDAGKQLLAMLQKSNSAALHTAINQASAGDYEALKRTVQSFLATPEAKAMIEKLGRPDYGRP